MSRLATSFLLVAVTAPTLLATGCGASAVHPIEAAAATHSATFEVEGMTCAACSVTVRTAVRQLDGVGTVEVAQTAGRATVTFDGGMISAQQIAERISRAGYEAAVLSEREV